MAVRIIESEEKVYPKYKIYMNGFIVGVVFSRDKCTIKASTKLMYSYYAPYFGNHSIKDPNKIIEYLDELHDKSLKIGDGYDNYSKARKIIADYISSNQVRDTKEFKNNVKNMFSEIEKFLNSNGVKFDKIVGVGNIDDYYDKRLSEINKFDVAMTVRYSSGDASVSYIQFSMRTELEKYKNKIIDIIKKYIDADVYDEEITNSEEDEEYFGSPDVLTVKLATV